MQPEDQNNPDKQSLNPQPLPPKETQTPSQTLNPTPAAEPTPVDPSPTPQLQSNPPLQPTASKKPSPMLWVIIGVVALVVIVVIVFIAMGMGSKNNSTTQQSQNTTTDTQNNLLADAYTDTKLGISMQFPKGWDKVDNPQVDQLASVAYRDPQPDSADGKQLYANLTVASQSASGASLNAYTKSATDEISKQPTYKAIGSKNGTINGIDARFITYSITSGDTTITIEQAILIKNNKAYVISGTALPQAFNQRKALLEASINTFKIK